MDTEIYIPVKLILTYLIVLARVAGLVTFAPFWNISSVPKQIKIIMVLCLSFIITLLVGKNIALPSWDYLALFIVIIGEVVIGSLIGFIGQLTFSALDIATQIMATQLGFSLGNIINPTNRTQTSALGILAQMLALVIFLAINGHHWFLTATIKSFVSFTPGAFSLSIDLMDKIIHLSAYAITMGLALAAPAMIILFATEILIALSGRVAPQLQILLISFPIKIMLGLVLLGSVLYVLPHQIRQILATINILLKEIF